jgi:type VI secretion system protein ImpF
MPETERDQEVVPSVFDRLIEEHDPRRRYHPSTAQLTMAVRQDLEDLLNTRQRCVSLPPGTDKLEFSIVNYGVPDPLGYDLSSPDRIESFREEIETAIKRFERRFTRVRVSLMEDRGTVDRILRFRIEASMSMELGREFLIFSLDVEPATKQIRVSRAS